ncbi:MAG: mannose-6-phosphate isomerase, class I [Succinivibrio sp.]
MKVINGVVKDYAWGGYSYIPMFLDKVPNGSPCAEYWLGEHPAGTATLEDGTKLNDYIDADAKSVLGDSVCREYAGRLPYLLKILDVREPLSIQVHPTLEQARAGFDREERENVPANLRNYKDNNHKPELMLALSDFYLLHGFADSKKAIENLSGFASTKPLSEKYKEMGLCRFVDYIFSQPKEELEKILSPIVDDNKAAYEEGRISKSAPLFWFVRAALRARECGQALDAGLIMVLIMNLMYVRTGEVVFQGAGIPHAYLEGQNVELMANSDNVIRGGLTPKLVDVKELLKIVKFEEVTPKIIAATAQSDGGEVFNVPVKDFKLVKYSLKAGEKLSVCKDGCASIFLAMSGEFRLSNSDRYFTKGMALFNSADEETQIEAVNDVVLYKATSAL